MLYKQVAATHKKKYVSEDLTTEITTTADKITTIHSSDEEIVIDDNIIVQEDSANTRKVEINLDTGLPEIRDIEEKTIDISRMRHSKFMYSPQSHKRLPL